mgnify:CR=1 FL=1
MKTSKKRKMPKTRAEFEETLINTFIAGCIHGYGVEHSQNVYEQERTGALLWIGRISKEEYDRKMDELLN